MRSAKIGWLLLKCCSQNRQKTEGQIAECTKRMLKYVKQKIPTVEFHPNSENIG